MAANAGVEVENDKPWNKNHYLLPSCSGFLGVICAILQLVSIATPYWIIFASEDPKGTGSLSKPAGEYVEAGHAGLWKLCLIIYNDVPIDSCQIKATYFKPGNLRFVAGGFAILNLVFLFLFLAPIPAQLIYLMKGNSVVRFRYRNITIIKIITSLLGALSATAAVIIICINGNNNNTFVITKGWSFGLQVVEIILQVFIIIASGTEHVVGKNFDRTNLPTSATAMSESFSSIPPSNDTFQSDSPANGKPKSQNPKISIYVIPDGAKHPLIIENGYRKQTPSPTPPPSYETQQEVHEEQPKKHFVKKSKKQTSSDTTETPSSKLSTSNLDAQGEGLERHRSIGEELNVAGCRKSMQYMEPLTIEDEPEEKTADSSSGHHFKNSGFHSSKESGLNSSLGSASRIDIVDNSSTFDNHGFNGSSLSIKSIRSTDV